MKKIFFLLILSFIYFSKANATVSCDPKFKFFGFSNNNDKAYFEKKNSGDCDEKYYMYEYSLDTRKLKKLAESKSKSLKYEAIKRKIFQEGMQIPEVFDDGNFHCKLDRPFFKLEEEGQFKTKKFKEVYHNKKYNIWLTIREHCYAAAMAGYNRSNCPTNESIALYEITDCEQQTN